MKQKIVGKSLWTANPNSIDGYPFEDFRKEVCVDGWYVKQISTCARGGGDIYVTLLLEKED